MLASSSQGEVVEALRERLYKLQTARRPAGAFSCGCTALDRALPGRGLHRGTLVEYLAPLGSGATALALIAGREACREGGALVVVDRQRTFHPPAAANLGIELANVIFVRPTTRKDYLWALNQSLSCQGVGAVVGWPQRLDSNTFRQWQLAAENAGTLGLLIRPPDVRGQPSWSELQLLVETRPAPASSARASAAMPMAAVSMAAVSRTASSAAVSKIASVRQLRVEIVRCRNGNPGAVVELELDDETGMLQESHAVRMAAKLARATSAKRSSGA